VWGGTDQFLGAAADRTSFALIFALAMAVTSIPVISRIMSDLGVLGTRFALIVLSVAVLEDLVVYVILNIALARVALTGAKSFGLPALLDIAPSTPLGQSYYVVCTLAFFAWHSWWGPSMSGRWPRCAATRCAGAVPSHSSSWCSLS
jgi:Kef-type K+ transport system membrane component KefB